MSPKEHSPGHFWSPSHVGQKPWFHPLPSRPPLNQPATADSRHWTGPCVHRWLECKGVTHQINIIRFLPVPLFPHQGQEAVWAVWKVCLVWSILGTMESLECSGHRNRGQCHRHRQMPLPWVQMNRQHSQFAGWEPCDLLTTTEKW